MTESTHTLIPAAVEMLQALKDLLPLLCCCFISGGMSGIAALAFLRKHHIGPDHEL